MGTLYVVATPIGNLEDVSTRALRVLREVSLIAAEDTRHTGKLLGHFDIATPLMSYHAFNERARLEPVLAVLDAGDVALVSDAGTPGVSDPGALLVDAALDAGHMVRSVPGPSALTAAVAVSGLLPGPFSFLGFLPREGVVRRELIARASAVGFGIVLFEAPGRLARTLDELAAPLSGRRFAVVRELSKVHETVARGRFGEPAASLAERNARGEIVIVVEGGTVAVIAEDPRELVERLLASGLKPSEAAREAATLTRLPRSDLYALASEVKRAGGER